MERISARRIQFGLRALLLLTAFAACAVRPSRMLMERLTRDASPTVHVPDGGSLVLSGVVFQADGTRVRSNGTAAAAACAAPRLRRGLKANDPPPRASNLYAPRIIIDEPPEQLAPRPAGS